MRRLLLIMGVALATSACTTDRMAHGCYDRLLQGSAIHIGSNGCGVEPLDWVQDDTIGEEHT